MRVAINMRLLVPGKMDGIGWFTYETTRRLVSQHPEHEFFLFFDRQPDSSFQFGSNAKEVVLWPPTRHPLLWWMWFEVMVPAMLKRHKIDLFLSPDGYLPLHGSIPALSVIHDINFEHYKGNLRASHQRYFTHYFPRFARQAERIATVSEYSRQDIAATYGIDPAKIDVVYDGYGDGYRPHTEQEKAEVRQRYADGKPYIIFVSTILPRKNLQHLLLAFDAVKRSEQSDLQLLVVGNRAWWGEELALAWHACECQKEVHFLGHLDQPTVAALLSGAEMLVYPSYFEGFGIPILEAMQAETPVVCSRTTSMPEVGGDAVLYVDPTNTSSIAEAIQRLRSPQLRNELIEKGRLQRQHFSWQRTADLLWQSMQKVIPTL